MVTEAGKAGFALREFELTDFGAVGDGNPDSAPINDQAFVNLLDALGDRGGRVRISQGIYRFDKPLRLARTLHE